MKTEWDYTELASAYLKRPDYAGPAIDRMLDLADMRSGAAVCDIGAGAGHLTRQLAARGLTVLAVEPNDAMRAQGLQRTAGLSNVRWHDAVAEHTGLPADAFALVAFGSSFNVTDRPLALKEAARILAARGWFACLWNHRDLGDPLQAAVEDAIRRHIPDYHYGSRREDQTAIIEESGLFDAVHRFEAAIVHEQEVGDCLEAWRSHATLRRQAGARFDHVIESIGYVLSQVNQPVLRIPYTTRVWMARRR